MTETIAIISLGAGVQSTTLFLLACAGEISPAPVAAIFADTGWEPRAVYDHLAWLESIGTIPIYRVSDGNIRDNALHKPLGVDMPLYLTGARGPGILRRQCTGKYKIAPIRRQTRALMREHGAARAIVMMGISLDEVQRMRDSDVRYIENRYPLVDRRMTRQDCLVWLERQGYPRPPKSACIGCPYHSDATWSAMRQTAPEEFAEACDFDDAIRQARPGYTTFLHKKRIPLRQVDFRTPQERGQLDLFDGMDDECEGVCGV